MRDVGVPSMGAGRRQRVDEERGDGGCGGVYDVTGVYNVTGV
jgi:hypothetical protein